MIERGPDDPYNEAAAIMKLRSVCAAFGWPVEMAINHLMACSIDLALNIYGPEATEAWFKDMSEKLGPMLKQRAETRVH